MKTEPPRDCGTCSTLIVSSDPSSSDSTIGVGPDVGRLADLHADVEVAARRRPAAGGARDRDPLDVGRHRGAGHDPAGGPVGLGAGGHDADPTDPTGDPTAGPTADSTGGRFSAWSIRSRIRRTHMPPASMLRL